MIDLVYGSNAHAATISAGAWAIPLPNSYRFLTRFLLDPGDTVEHLVVLTLEFKPAGNVGDLLASLVAAVNARVPACPSLSDPVVRVGFDPVEVHGQEGFLDELFVLEAGGEERDVVRVPSSRALIGMM